MELTLNHTYRLVFNAALGTCVPAPETANGAGKSRSGGMRAGDLRAAGTRPGALARTALALALAAALPAQAQTWQGTTIDYHDASNWNPGVVPASPLNANFGATGSALVEITSDVAIGAFQFASDAQSYEFLVTNGAALRFFGGGIVDPASTGPLIQISGTGSLQFHNNASAGDAVIHSTGSLIVFAGNATGGDATITSNANMNVGGNSNLQNARVNVSNGRVLRFVDNASGGQAAVSITNGSELRFNNYVSAGTMIGSLSGDGNVFLDDFSTGIAKVLTIGGNNQSTTFSGRIQEGGSIVKEGTGTLTLTGNNDFSGGLTINAGTLQVGNGGTSGALGTGAVANNASLVFNRSDTVTVGNAISGTGSVTQAGSGTLVLTGANTYQGGTNLNAGTIEVGTSDALGTGNLRFAGGTLRATQSHVQSHSSLFAAGTTSSIRAAAGQTLVMDGAWSVGGGAQLHVGSATDTGTVVLRNGGTSLVTAPFTQQLWIDGGTLTTEAGSVLLPFLTDSFAATHVAAGATLDFAGNNAQIKNLQGLGAVKTGSAFVVLEAADFGGVIDGTGGLRKASSGTAILHGENTYSGGTLVQQGVLQVGNGGASGTLGDGDVTISNGATLRFNRNDTAVVDNRIAGSAGSILQQSGPGTTVLTADSSFNGTVDIDAGTLQLGNGGATGMLGATATYDVASGATLAFNRDGTVNFANAVSGDGRVVQNGTGTVVLSGANSYTGGTVINSGTVQVGTAGALGGGSLTLAGGTLRATADIALAPTSLNFGAGETSTIAAAAGTTLLLDSFTTMQTGSVMRFGSAADTGTVHFSVSGGNVNDVPTLAIEVAGGTLRAGNGGFGNLSDLVGTVRIEAGATLDANGMNAGFTNLRGAGTLTTAAAATLTVRSGDFDGRIRGAANLAKTTAGTLILGGDNDYSGTTSIGAGGTLQVGKGGPTGTLGTGAVLNNGHLRFDRNDMFVVDNTISGTGSLEKAGAGYMLVTADNNYAGTTTISGGGLQVGGGAGTGSLGTGNIVNNGALSFLRTGTLTVNSISGTGSLYQSGPGTVVLAANNSYAGTTTVSQGTLQVGNGGSTGSLGTGSVAIENGGTLAFDRDNFHVATNTISTSTTGHLHHRGTGVLVLVADNGYTDTIIDRGTLAVSFNGTTGSLGTGSVTNNGTLAFVRTNDMTVANTIGGTGAVQQVGSGRTILTANNGYAGATTIAAGVLQVGAGGTTGTLGTGAVQNDAALVFNRSDDVVLGNAISGTGSFEQAGTGRVTLTSDNGYAGGTVISRGILQVGAGGISGSLGSGAVTNNAALAFDRSDDVTVGNAISGTGTLEQAGGGRLTLTGGNSYGATVISAGTLQVGNGGTTGSLGSGNVTNNGALAFNRSDTVSLANAISGTGSLTQAGGGNLVLTGASTYTGGTFVNAGTLSVNGSIVGNTTVNNGGTLGGAGSVGSVAVASGGTLAPGNSIGALSVNGNLAFAPGSTYRVEANAAGASDRVNAVGAGTITINGGTVDVQAGGAGYQRNTDYTILSSGGATTGQFDSVTSNLAFLTPTLIYSANGVVLNLQSGTAPEYASVARTPNQTAVANYLQGIANTPGDAAALIQQIDNMTADQASASFESMAGSAHASASQVAGALGRNFSATLASRSGFSTSGLGNAMNDWSQVRYASLAPVETSLASAQERGLWAQALGAGGRMDSDGNAAGSRYRNSGLVLGYDQPVTGQWLAGGAVGYSTSWWNATSGDPSSGKIESPQAGLYARYTTDSLRVRIDGTFSSHDFTTDRTVNIAGVGATANSKHKGREWGLAGQVEMPIKAGEWELRPLAGLRYAHLNEDGFSETGQSPANLAVAERTNQNTLLSAGMHFVRPFNQGKAGLELRAVASHLAGDNDSPVTASLIGQPGSFTATGVPLKRNALTLGTTVSGQFTRNVSAYLDANYEYRGSGQNAYQFTGGVRVSF